MLFFAFLMSLLLVVKAGARPVKDALKLPAIPQKKSVRLFGVDLEVVPPLATHSNHPVSPSLVFESSNLDAEPSGQGSSSAAKKNKKPSETDRHVSSRDAPSSSSQSRRHFRLEEFFENGSLHLKDLKSTYRYKEDDDGPRKNTVACRRKYAKKRALGLRCNESFSEEDRYKSLEEVLAGLGAEGAFELSDRQLGYRDLVERKKSLGLTRSDRLPEDHYRSVGRPALKPAGAARIDDNQNNAEAEADAPTKDLVRVRRPAEIKSAKAASNAATASASQDTDPVETSQKIQSGTSWGMRRPRSSDNAK
jgi:hypothetical protein